MKKKIEINKEIVEVDVLNQTDDSIEFIFEGEKYLFDLKEKKAQTIILSKANEQGFAHVFESSVFTQGREFQIQKPEVHQKKKNREGADLISPMPGKIFKILKSQGDVKTGETILILEAMKMEHSIKAPKDGRIKKILFKEGDLVQGGVDLVEMEES